MSSNAEILADFIGDKEQILITVDSMKALYSEQIRDKVDRLWDRIVKDNYLFNGIVANLHCYSFSEDKLMLTLREDEYRYFYALNLKNAVPDNYTNTLAICSVVVTADKMIVIGKRSMLLAEGNEEWHVPGGTIDERVLMGMHPLDMMKAELEEELNISESDIISIKCIGLGVNHVYHKPEILTYTELSINSQELSQKMEFAKDFREHSCIRFLKANEIDDFLCKNKIAPIGELCLERFMKVYWKEV